MSAQTTRTLVLGVATLFEPANGYQLRRELLSWDIEQWANVNPGSIYSMLSTLTRQGLLEAHILPEGARSVTVYTTTAEGRVELQRLIREGVVTVSAMDPTLFRVAFGLISLVARSDFLSWLEEREVAVSAGVIALAEAARGVLSSTFTPPHVGHSLDLESRMLAAQGEWLRELLEIVRGGGLSFAGEEMDWRPSDDDAGWQMVRDRARYTQQLDRA